MRVTKQIKRPAKQEVVVEQTVPLPLVSNYFAERYLKRRKNLFELHDEIIVDVIPPRDDTASEPSDARKLLLQNSVSRALPPYTTLFAWYCKMQQQPALHLPRTNCKITLAQPKRDRPARNFTNKNKARVYHNNECLSFSAIVLYATSRMPRFDYDQASHICGHGRCINPDHLVWECMASNARRNMCHAYNCECNCKPKCLPCYESDCAYIKQALTK